MKNFMEEVQKTCREVSCELEMVNPVNHMSASKNEFSPLKKSRKDIELDLIGGNKLKMRK